MIIGETTCDGKKKMYELLNELKRTHILHLPQGRDRAYERELVRGVLPAQGGARGFYGITITDDDLRAAVRRRNRLRAAQLEMFALQANQPAAMSGVDLMSTMFAGTFSFDIEAIRSSWSKRSPSCARPMMQASARSRRMPSAF